VISCRVFGLPVCWVDVCVCVCTRQRQCGGGGWGTAEWGAREGGEAEKKGSRAGPSHGPRLGGRHTHSVTLAVFHALRSPLKLAALINM
jgi:hypothetical protein